jgi:hypothetical protein
MGIIDHAMKRTLFVLLLLLSPAWAQPEAEPTPARVVEGEWTVQAEPLEDSRARLQAQWEQARGENSADYWRTTLEDNKVQLEVGGTQELIGEAKTEYALEQEWQEELQNRRVRIAVTVPVSGWEGGVSSSLAWEAEGQQDWELQRTGLRGWLATPRWYGWRGEASYEQVVTGDKPTHTSKVGLSSPDQKVEAEVSRTPSVVCWTGRVSQRVGPGTLQFETAYSQGTHWDRSWLARYQCRLSRGARLAAQGSRRWSELLTQWEDRVEAQLEVRF